jgi:hypothetical protein
MIGTQLPVVAVLVEFTGIFLPSSYHWRVKQNNSLLFYLLAGRGRCPPRYWKNDANLLPLPFSALQAAGSARCPPGHIAAQVW